MQPKLLEEEEDKQSCLSTQNHYGWNKQEFFEWEYREQKDDEGYTREGPLDYLRPFHSLLSEDDYPDPQALQDFRDEFDEMLRQILEEEANRTKTVDYKASFHILNKLSSGGSDSEMGNLSGRKGGSLRASDSRGMIVLQKPARFNLSDVMGHFETDT